MHLHRIEAAGISAAADAGELYAIVDGCIGPEVSDLADALGPERAACLYLGVAAENYRDKAPYLLRVDRALALALPERFGDAAWGCFARSTAGFEAVRRHVRGLLTVTSPEGQSWLFRFWDPRLLPTFLRASTADELNAFFGPVSAFALVTGAGEAFAAYRDPAIVEAAPRRPVGERLAISVAQVAALRRASVADALVATLGGGARRDPANDDVLLAAPDGGVTRMHLGADGLVGGVTSPLGRHWAIGAREDGKLARFVTPSGSTLSIGYDADGRVAQVARDGEERFRADHDAAGRLQRVDFPDGTAAHNVYAFEGAAAVADPTGDFPAARRDRLGRVERFAYIGDRLTAVEDGNGNTTRFDHGLHPRPDAARFADGGVERYQYDPAGYLSRLVRADGAALEVDCDGGGRPTRIAAADGAVASFDYDGDGRLVAARNAEIALAWVYDDAGQLIEEHQGEVVIRHHHDAGGPVGITYPTGETVRWRRDTDQRIAELTDWAGGRYRIDYADGDAGWRLTGPDGTVTTSRQDRVGLPSATRVEADDRVLWDVAFAHDAEDRLCERRDTRLGRVAYDYDAEAQLIRATHDDGRDERFAYDGAGNRVACAEGTATFDACNRLLSQGATSYRHDARGRTVARSGPAGEWRLSYDGFDRLIAAEDAGGRKLTFGYDPLGRRVWKRAVGDGLDTLTRFVWAGEQLIREVVDRAGGWDPADAAPVARDYLYWPLAWTPLLLRERGTVYRYHADPRGAPVRLTAPGGRIAWEAETEAFGRARVLTAEVAQPLRLPGQFADDEFGLALHYNRHRYYDPATGRYITPDPLGIVAGLNLYQYVGNDPVNGADPLGLAWWKTALAVAAAVAVAAVVVIAAPLILPAALGAFAIGAITTVAAGTLAGATGFMVNEALNEETLCKRCILMAGLKGAGVGALASVPFVFLPAAAGYAAYAGTGAVSGAVGYSADWAMTPGMPWNWGDFGKSVAWGAALGPAGKFIGGRIPIRRPYAALQDRPSVGAGKTFTPAQKNAIYAENMRRNNGVLRSDETGEPLIRPSQSRRGVTPPGDEAQVDHINPRIPADPNASPGTNSYGNARVISRDANAAKSNSPPVNNQRVPAPAVPSDNKRP